MNIAAENEIVECEDENLDPYELYLQENERRDRELIEFVDEFINSSEMCLFKKEEIVEIPHRPRRKPKVKPIKKPLSNIERFNRIRILEERFERHLEEQTIKNILKCQEEGISVIRQKIYEAKRFYLCHQKERKELEESRRIRALEQLKDIYHVDTTFLSTKSKPVERMLIYNKLNNIRKAKQKQRKKDIVKKIVNEYIRQAQIDNLRNKKYYDLVVPKDKIIKNFFIIGTEMTLYEEQASVIEEEHIEEVPVLEIKTVEVEETSSPKKKDKKKDKEDKKSKKSPKDKSSKKSKKDKKDKKGKGKKGKNKEKPNAEHVFPNIPITNPRDKIQLPEESDIQGFINELDTMEKIDAEKLKYLREKMHMEKIMYPEDPFFSWSPKLVEFYGYKKDIIYKKKIRILNGGTCVMKCRFHSVRLEEFHPCLIEVEPIDIQSVIPGFLFTATVKFTPEDLSKIIKGNIIFVTYQSNKAEYRHISIPVTCVPLCSNVTITPNIITFETLPIWQARRMSDYKNYEVLQITNSGNKGCKIVMSRVKDPFNLETMSTNLIQDNSTLEDSVNQYDVGENMEGNLGSQLYDTAFEMMVPVSESELIVEECIREYIDNIFKPFRFDNYCLLLNPNSKLTINIFLKNVDYVGSYIEKYIISVFEEFEEQIWNCIGTQVSERNYLVIFTKFFKTHDFK